MPLKINKILKTQSGLDVPLGSFVAFNILIDGLKVRVQPLYYISEVAFIAGEGQTLLEDAGNDLPGIAERTITPAQYNTWDIKEKAEEFFKSEIEIITGVGTVDIVSYPV